MCDYWQELNVIVCVSKRGRGERERERERDDFHNKTQTYRGNHLNTCLCIPMQTQSSVHAYAALNH